MQHATRICLLPSQPLLSNCHLLVPNPVPCLVLYLMPPLVLLTLFVPLFEFSICMVCLTMVISYLGYLALLMCPVYALNCLCVTGMTNIINIPYT